MILWSAFWYRDKREVSEGERREEWKWRKGYWNWSYGVSVKGGESVLEEHVEDWLANEFKKMWKRQDEHLWV